jgi:hypothetical protein
MPFKIMGEREDYFARAIEAERLAADTGIAVLREALLEMAKGYRLLAQQVPVTSD